MKEKTKRQQKQDYKQYLYFAYKKAKHFVTKETSFVEHTSILLFEQDLDGNIQKLNQLLNNPSELGDRIKELQGEIYFTPKSFSSTGKPRIRPKVSFPFEYQVLWAAVILIIGEWFDTNAKVKNAYSMCDEAVRREFDWMVPWSFNGRLSRIKNDSSRVLKESDFEDSYIHYNSVRLYESHQLALRKLEKYKSQTINEMLTRKDKIYQGELDIKEFFPTLCREKIKAAMSERLNLLNDIKEFRAIEIEKIINKLFELKIIYPDIAKFNQVNGKFESVLLDYKNEIEEIYISKETGEISNKKAVGKSQDLEELVRILNQTLPLDLIASNFLSNCALNHYVDRKINKEFKFETENKELSIMRYTDDYMVFSTDEKLVRNVIDFIKAELNSIGLKSALMKTLPTKMIEVEKRLEELTKDKKISEGLLAYITERLPKNFLEFKRDTVTNETNFLEILGLNLNPKEITESSKDSSYFSKNLSTTSDVKLQALSDEELQLFMQEVFGYLQTDNDIGEVKQETVKIFAAWRLNASFREKSYRTYYDEDEISKFLNILERAIRKYPYKMGFYDVYLLTIFNTIENRDSRYNDLETFLVKLPDYIKALPEGGLIFATYFSSIRERILTIIHKNWYRFDEEKRKKIRIILERIFLKWYADPKIQWTEQYALYWSFSVLRIKLPIHFCVNQEEFPEYLQLLNRIYKGYIFVLQEENDVIEDKDDPSISILLKVFSEGLYWNEIKGQFEFNEADLSLYQKIEAEILSSTNLYNWLNFARVSDSLMKKNHFELIEKVMKDTIDQTLKKTEIHFEVLDYLQGYIKKYFEKPNQYDAIYEWINSREKKRSTNIYKKYVEERFKAYTKIRSYYALADKNLQKLPSLEITEDDEISIADWIFYCELMPYHLEMIPSKHDVLHPITEYEYVKILNEIKKKKYNLKNENIEEDEGVLFSCKLSFKEWEMLRKSEQCIDCRGYENCEKCEECSKYTEYSESETKEYAELMFAMLTNRPHHAHIKKHYSMYKWNDLQSYFEMTYYPSTKVASLFVNNLNIHHDFYRKVYSMPTEELPYREVYESVNTGHNIGQWIKEYLETIEKELIRKKYSRKLELLEIDTNQLRG